MKTEERSAPSRTTKPKDAEPGFSPEPNLHPQHEEGSDPTALTVQNLMKYCSTVAAMNRQYTSE